MGERRRGSSVQEIRIVRPNSASRSQLSSAICVNMNAALHGSTAATAR
jgi:hypothetical protein